MQVNLRLLTHANLQRLVHAVDQLYQPIQVPQMPRHFAAILEDLIPGEFHGVTIVARSTNAADPIRRATIYPVPAQWESLATTFSNRYSQFPLGPIRESGNLHEPLALSDVESRAKIERLDLYHDYYRVLGVEDDLSVNFGSQAHRVCLAILRGQRGFSDQDRAILAVLRPHMERAYRFTRLLESSRTNGRGKQPPAGAPVDIAESNDNQGNPQSLRSLGLSQREAEVLYWVAAGKTSPVISTILGIRHDTVRTHLKSIYAKLGVENRLSAALRAHEILGTDFRNGYYSL
jgi:DNA-binding CsgD family transcriptional regulator